MRRGLLTLGPEVLRGLRFVCSDMWQPYLRVLAAKVPHALHVLDRFHITSHLNQALGQVRRAERGRLRGRPRAAKLKPLRWKLLRRGRRVRGRARRRLLGLLHTKLATARAWMLKETVQDFWRYRSLTRAATFLEAWCERALRSRLEPMRKVARRLRSHEELRGKFLNYHVLRWLQRCPRPVFMTRSQPYTKDDNAHLEQKNWTHMRQCFGYERHENLEVVAPINEWAKGQGSLGD